MARPSTINGYWGTVGETKRPRPNGPRVPRRQPHRGDRRGLPEALRGPALGAGRSALGAAWASGSGRGCHVGVGLRAAGVLWVSLENQNRKGGQLQKHRCVGRECGNEPFCVVGNHQSGSSFQSPTRGVLFHDWSRLHVAWLNHKLDGL